MKSNNQLAVLFFLLTRSWPPAVWWKRHMLRRNNCFDIHLSCHITITCLIAHGKFYLIQGKLAEAFSSNKRIFISSISSSQFLFSSESLGGLKFSLFKTLLNLALKDMLSHNIARCFWNFCKFNIYFLKCDHG